MSDDQAATRCALRPATRRTALCRAAARSAPQRRAGRSRGLAPSLRPPCEPGKISRGRSFLGRRSGKGAALVGEAVPVGEDALCAFEAKAGINLRYDFLGAMAVLGVVQHGIGRDARAHDQPGPDTLPGIRSASGQFFQSIRRGYVGAQWRGCQRPRWRRSASCRRSRSDAAVGRRYTDPDDWRRRVRQRSKRDSRSVSARFGC